MKFGGYLLSEINPEWAHAYLDYGRLKDLIKVLHERVALDDEDPEGLKGTSLSVPLPTNAAAAPKLTRKGSMDDTSTQVCARTP
jgi:hypothetical protein